MNTTHYKEPTEQKEKQKDGLLLDAISLRDYFAAKAMQGWVASSPVISGEPMNGSAEMAEQIAGASFILADAMLKAREA